MARVVSDGSPGAQILCFLCFLCDVQVPRCSFLMDSQISRRREQSLVPSHRKKNFTPKAALLWDIHDFPAYGLVTSWRTHGKLVCPICASSRIKSTKVASQLVRSAREDRLERENNRLRQENNHYCVRSLAEKGEVDFDDLMRSAAPGMATSDSEVGFERGRDAVAQDETELQTTICLSHRYYTLFLGA